MTATLETRTVSITEPGVYDLPADVYHRDPVPGGSLSCSGAKKLLSPSCPAIFHWEREHGEKPRDVFDFGTAAHRQVLGVGADIAEVPHDDWRTKAAQELREQARAEGKVPLLSKDVRVVEAMATKLREHPLAAQLLDPAHGQPEQALFWRDEQHGITRRALVDWLPRSVTGTRSKVVDYKTARTVEPFVLAKDVVTYGYDMQGGWYLDGVRALELDDDPEFYLVFQMKTAPYLVTVVQLPEETLLRGRQRNDEALAIYAECVRTDTWPGFVPETEVAHLSLPAWAVPDMEIGDPSWT